ncbi:MAG: magnesium/cobalt transporter CorA [Rhodocyclaceae bacterium]|nr:magnesium/cobalt transporter CorA [Rhodocyclaceae bacterium]
MARTRTKRSRKLGLPPGSLVHLGERKTASPGISLIEFDGNGLAEHNFETIAASRSYQPRHKTLWLNVHGLHDPEVLAEIGERFGLHPLVLEDVLNTDQRPKVEEYGDYLYLVARMLTMNADGSEVLSEQVSIVLGTNFVLSFQERPTGTFDPLRERLRQDKRRIRSEGADYIAYAMLDVMVDHYFGLMESLGERIDAMEDMLLDQPSRELLHRLHELKRVTLQLRRAIWPLREAIHQLQHVSGELLRPATQIYLRDVYDHTVHLLESLDTHRDLLAGMLDIYLSSVSNRLNQELRALTVITTLFLPAGLIAGTFGMNFRSMPLLDDAQGFLIALGLMAGVALAMAALFWRRNWLR